MTSRARTIATPELWSIGMELAVSLPLLRPGVKPTPITTADEGQEECYAMTRIAASYMS